MEWISKVLWNPEEDETPKYIYLIKPMPILYINQLTADRRTICIFILFFCVAESEINSQSARNRVPSDDK